jgi:hypothetical protein
MPFTVGQVLPEYRVRAKNGAVHSDNKIHDNEVAKQYGFAGGLVPGVTIHAYMTRPAVDAFGRDWVERGTISSRFTKPFYEGELVTVRATVTGVSAELVSLELEARNEAGAVNAIGTATLPAIGAAPPSLRDFPSAPLPERLPMASESVFEAMDIMGAVDVTPARLEKDAGFLEEVSDDHPLWRGPGAILHPGYLIRFANAILVQNVQLGPWIHVSSDVTHFAAQSATKGFSTRGRVIEHFEKKGHKFVALDVLVAGDDGQPLMRAHHTAIYHVRKLADS